MKAIENLQKTQLPTPEQLNDPDFSLERYIIAEAARKQAVAELLEGYQELMPDANSPT